jgi:MYXO-CTERM domain-containing protein
MNTKILLGLTAGVGSLILAGTATADFQGLSLEVVDNGGLVAGTTYDVYANVDAGGRVDAVYGDGTNVLSIGVNGGNFVQNAFGGNTSMDINAAFLPMFPSLAYDSFVTIGLTDSTGNALNNIGIDFTGFAAGGTLSTDNGTWFVTPDDAQGNESDGRVLLGRFTIDGGTLEGSLNLQGRDVNGTVWNADGIALGAIPAPGALALLGLAGLASRRRRK